MLISITTVNSCELVNGSQKTYQVAVQVSSQVPPLIMSFAGLDDATAFVTRCYAGDGKQFVASIMKYVEDK